jgi:alkylation response protein AidB-like acyl-CoA dehydrogenase
VQAREILALLGQGGWIRHALPAAWGGIEHGPDFRACCLVREALAAASPLADDIFALQCLASMPISLAGSDEQKESILPGVAKGETMLAFAMTEAEAGSDVAGMGTRARRQADGGWLLEGRKHLISNAGLADLYTVLAVSEKEAGNRGISCFLVPATQPGFSFVRAQIMASPHPLGEIAFTGCQLPESSLLGAAGGGFKLAMGTLDRLRPTVAAAACGMAERALAEGLAHARRRHQFGQPLAGFQLIQQKLARMDTDLAAARLLTYRAAAEADSGAKRVTREAARAKYFATEAAQRIVDDAVQIVGGLGVLMDHPVDRLYRSVRALRIYEGTSEIQQLIIARQLLRSDD